MRLLEVLEDARELGFLGPGAVESHLEHAEGFAQAYGGPPAGGCVDLGTGGGVPGLVLAVRWPTSRWTLVEAGERRAAFLAGAVEGLGLPNVEVVRTRAEDFGRDPANRAAMVLVTARGFGPPAVTAECAAPLLAVGGTLVVSEPPEEEASRWPADGLAILGLAPAGRRRAGAWYARMTKAAPTPDRFPRRPGLPAKRPLW